MEEELENLIAQMDDAASRLVEEDREEFFSKASDAAYSRYLKAQGEEE